MAGERHNDEENFKKVWSRVLDEVGYVDAEKPVEKSRQKSRNFDRVKDDDYYVKKIQDLVNKKVAQFDSEKQRSKRKRVIFCLQDLDFPTINVSSINKLKEFIANELKGVDLKLVIEKQLYETDLKVSQNRLSMPLKQIKNMDFLTMKEKSDLDSGKHFEVAVVGPTMEVFKKPLVLKMWNLRTTQNYVLRTNWNEFVKANKEHLKVRSMVQIWAFRREGSLCFGIA